jgi:hypothetical protein
MLLASSEQCGTSYSCFPALTTAATDAPGYALCQLRITDGCPSLKAADPHFDCFTSRPQHLGPRLNPPKRHTHPRFLNSHSIAQYTSVHESDESIGTPCFPLPLGAAVCQPCAET